jgi:pyrroloquinoline-quinone synthase
MSVQFQPHVHTRFERGLDIQRAANELAGRVLDHPFMIRCKDGTVSWGELRSFLIQHGKYGAYFTRYLCALLSQIEDAGDVVRLAENLAEELGYGGDQTGVPHSLVYAGMLRKFDIIADQYDTNAATQNLIDTMLMLCRQGRGATGLGALYLGAEAIVPAVYSRLIQGFRHRGIADADLHFFTIHVECDDDHAKTMQGIMERMIASQPSSAATMLNAGELAIHARLRFFDALLAEVPQ